MSMHTLPQLSHPTFELVFPSNGKKATFRPMQTRDRKALLMAMEGGDLAEMSRAVKRVVTSCVENVNPDTLPVFDLEWAFLQLVIHSIKDTVDVFVSIPNRESECDECGKRKLYKVSLKEAKVEGLKKNKKEFQVDLGGGIGLKLKYPTEGALSEFASTSKNKSEIEKLMDLTSLAIDCVYDTDSTTSFNEFPYEQKIQFLEQLPIDQYDKLESFVLTLPKLVLRIPIKCTKCRFEIEHVIEGLNDFFE